MYKALIPFVKQKKIFYLALVALVLIVLNVLLLSTLNNKIHQNGKQLTQQIYELQINTHADKNVVEALAQSKGFMLAAQSNTVHFKYLVDIQRDVFSYKTLSISLYYWPAWVEQGHLFILLNLIVLGAIGWWVKWWKVLVKKPTPFKSIPFSATNTATKLAAQVPALNCEVKSMYGVTSVKHSLFAIVQCDCEFDPNTDTQASFKVMIAKYFKELPNISINLFSANNLAITFNNIPAAKLEHYSERLHECVYQICLRYRSTVKRKNIKVGMCNYQLGADQSAIFKLAKSALLLSEGSLIQHWHRLPLQYDQGNLISGKEVIENIKKNKFILFFQPLFTLTTGDILQHEVLIRIRQQPHGLLAARYFINQDFNNQEAFELDTAVLLQVKKLILAEPTALTVSVNLHISNWFNDKFWNWFVDNMEDFTENRKLQFEMSEADFIKYQVQLTPAFEKLSSMHSLLVIDNFHHLENMNKIAAHKLVSGVKLGYELVHNIDEKTLQQKEVKRIVTQSKLLGIPVYAVGVETQKELLMLAKLGAVAAQGFYFSEPLQEFNHATFY